MNIQSIRLFLISCSEQVEYENQRSDVERFVIGIKGFGYEDVCTTHVSEVEFC